MTPILVNGPFVALRDQFFDFCLRVMAVPVKKNLADASIQLPTVGVLSASNSPSALSARAGYAKVK